MHAFHPAKHVCILHFPLIQYHHRAAANNALKPSAGVPELSEQEVQKQQEALESLLTARNQGDADQQASDSTATEDGIAGTDSQQEAMTAALEQLQEQYQARIHRSGEAKEGNARTLNANPAPAVFGLGVAQGGGEPHGEALDQ